MPKTKRKSKTPNMQVTKRSTRARAKRGRASGDEVQKYDPLGYGEGRGHEQKAGGRSAEDERYWQHAKYRKRTEKPAR
ncbi:MAG: hypothetical protein JNK82_23350 [Myxococcaceae bacterium]|nr:hypothetical protein [Myxococcaceae bacterium]